jgi:transcriptional regulator with XRE-family HTH domain
MPDDLNDAYSVRIGAVIDRLCGLFRLKQAQLSKATGVSPHTLSVIVQGKVEARRSTYAKLFDWFGLPLTDDFKILMPLIEARFDEIDAKARELRKES